MLELRVCVHPERKSFADFHNDIFGSLNDELYLFLDDDAVPDKRVFELQRHMLADDRLMACCGQPVCTDLGLTENRKVERVNKLCFKPNFNFFCVVVNGRFLREKVRVPSYLECSEDDFVKQRIKEENQRFLVTEHKFPHVSNDWEKKLLVGLKWHTANQTMHYLNNGGVTDEVCRQVMRKQEVNKYANNILRLAQKIDRKMAWQMKNAILTGFFNYTDYIRNR
jgi:hypothetical protein